MEISAVLLDLDGTLHDHARSARRGFADWLLASTNEVDRHLDAWLRFEALHFDAYLAGELTYGEQRRRRVADMRKYLGLEPLDVEGLEASFDIYRSGYQAGWSAYDDVLPALETLASGAYQLGILTNGDQVPQQLKADAIGVTAFVPRVVATSTLSAAKPDAAAFIGCCERLHVEPGTTVYVGDSLRIDAVGAASAGLLGVWLDRIGSGVADVPWSGPTITTLLELPGLLSRLALR